MNQRSGAVSTRSGRPALSRDALNPPLALPALGDASGCPQPAALRSLTFLASSDTIADAALR
ncbi:MAG: hypothetical protein JNL19_14955 [Burkholderiales bacterium]|nr:hypothetical protein [Burkholderiales bacterium]